MVGDLPVASNAAGVDEGTRGGTGRRQLEGGLAERLHLSPYTSYAISLRLSSNLKNGDTHS